MIMRQVAVENPWLPTDRPLSERRVRSTHRSGFMIAARTMVRMMKTKHDSRANGRNLIRYSASIGATSYILEGELVKGHNVDEMLPRAHHQIIANRLISCNTRLGRQLKFADRQYRRNVSVIHPRYVP